MKIITTYIMLIVTLLSVPVFTYFFGTAPGPAEWEAIRTLVIIASVSAAFSFLVGELTGNNSQVDKLWSILPVVYVWAVAAYAGFSPRLLLMAALVSVWGIRLTVNFALKGAYTWKFWAGEEDYRWQVLRRKPAFSPRWKWTMFNLLFISGYQNALILLFTLPAVVVMQQQDTPIDLFDLAVAFLMLFFIAFETMADLQQWRFQQEKKKAARNGSDPWGYLKKGFIDRGLWARSRHPNYFAEQAIWVCFYLFSVSAGGQWLNWSISGCLLLIVLFQGSSAFAEEISAGKYPEYQDYQKRVPRFIPFGFLR
jgi:steroid 5-alpha reductase family enzyme